MPNPPAQPDPLSSLLADGAWLKRLAVGLVGESGAEDLAQDVMVSAMRTPPEGTGAQLRAWAKTVARRLAARGGERGRNREHAEMRAARPEASDEASEQRLHLHRRLTDAILVLEPAHRTVLVMRFLDDLSPKEIAARLDIAQPTARKRISRALAKLREQLDGEFGDRTTWMNAVGPLAFGVDWKDMLPTAAMAPAAATLTPLIALWTMKKLAITSIVLCLALWTGFEFLGGEQADLQNPTGDETQAGLVPMAEPEPETTPALASTQTTEVRSQAAPIAPISQPTGLAQIILLAPNGNPAPDGKGVWFDENMVVHPMDFDDSGRADLPKASSGALCIVRAEGLAITDFLIESVEEDRTVRLPELVTLRGQLLVDGGPPSQGVDLECFSQFRPTCIEEPPGRISQDQGELLRELGLTGLTQCTQTRPDGTFEFDSVLPRMGGFVRFPKHLKLEADERQSVALFTPETQRLLIETTAYPHVVGRLLWADDGRPYVGNISVGYMDQTGVVSEWRNFRVFESGGFAIPLEYRGGKKSNGILHRSVRVSVSADLTSESQKFEHALDGDRFRWDMGDLLVQRVRLDQIQVVDRHGRAIPEAHVWGSKGRGLTDARGFVELSVERGERIHALAAGFAKGSVETSVASQEADGVWVITMGDGVGIQLSCTLPGGQSPEEASPFIRMWVERGNLGPNGEDPLGNGADWLGGVRAHSGLSIGKNKIWTTFHDVTRPIMLPELLPGTEVGFDLVDALGGVLVHKTITVRSEPGIMEVLLAPDPKTTGSLELDVVDGAGHSISEASIQGQSERFALPQFWLKGSSRTVFPLAAGPRTLRVAAEGYAPNTVEVQVHPSRQERRVTLLEARSLTVQLVDDDGGQIVYESVALWDRNGFLIDSHKGPASGECGFLNVPMEPMEVVALVGTEFVRRMIDSNEDGVLIRLPVQGSLRTHIEEFPKLTGEYGRIAMYVPDGEDRGATLLNRSNSFAEGATGSWDLEASLQPGTYPVIVAFCSDSSVPGNTATRTLFEGRVTVVAGEDTLIVVTGGADPRASLISR